MTIYQILSTHGDTSNDPHYDLAEDRIYDK